ncbi:MAG: universal stress protein [Candidatus Tectomicrobia bacterium]|nr:universal stress protein [Candidatus Tectomicrobia bacterium]
MDLKNLLVPTDFSEDADRAVDYAVGLAQELKASLTLMTATYIGDTPEVSQSYIEKVRAEAQHRIEAVRQRVEDTGVAVKVVMVSGPPAQRITETAQKEAADLIVMGTHGRTGLRHMLIGSVAERVVRHATCPVLVVPRQTEPH